MRFFYTTVLFLVSLCVSAQDYDIRFSRSSVDCETQQVCFDVQLKINGSGPFNLAGQNYRIYYNSALATYSSGSSLLPFPRYTHYTLVQDVSGSNASGTGSLPFESNLGFLNYF